MTDVFSKQKRSKIMSSIKGKNTEAEIKIRIALRKRDISGYRIHYKSLGKPDIAFPSKKIAIFVDGDFWHGYNWKKLGKIPPRRYWQAKINKNMERDRMITNNLRKDGWIVVRLWEHQISKNLDKCINRITEHL